MIETSSVAFDNLWISSVIFVRCSEIFGKCSETFVMPSEQFWKIFGNLRKVVGNLRKIVKNCVISTFNDKKNIKRLLEDMNFMLLWQELSRT